MPLDNITVRWVTVIVSLIIAFSGILYGATGRTNKTEILNANLKSQVALELARDNKTSIEVIKSEINHQTELLKEIAVNLRDHTK